MWPVGAAVLAIAAAGLTYWLIGNGSPQGPPVTSIELPLPAGRAGSPSAAVAIPRDGAAEFAKSAQGGDPALIEPSAIGPLPMVADDGRKAWHVYARPFDHTDRRPRITIVVNGLVLAVPETQPAINLLSSDVNLSI